MNIEQKTGYGAVARSNDIVCNSASGGIFTILSNWFMMKHPDDYYIAGVIWNDDFRGVHHVISNEIRVIDEMKVSKYVQSDKGKVFKEIKDLLNQNKYVMFVGCPCEIGGLKNFLGKNYSRLLTIDFLCKGVLPSKVMRDYIQMLEKKYDSKVINVNMRYKWPQMDIWIPQFILIEFHNGKKLLKEFYNTEIGHAFRIMQRESCYNCRFAGENHVSEISLGDFHGVNITAEYYNHLGTSAIIANGSIGKEIIGEISDELTIKEVSIEEILLHNFGYKNENRDKFSRYLVEMDLMKAVKECTDLKDKLKMKLPMNLVRKITVLKNKKKNK